MPRNKSQGNSNTPKPYTTRGNNVSKGGVLSKGSASYIETMVIRETKRKKKKEQKKTEDGIVRRLTKNDLIDKDKVGNVIKNSSKTKKKNNKKGSSSSSYADSSSDSDADCDSSCESCDKVRIVTPRRLWQDSPQPAPPTTSVSSGRAGGLVAIEMSLGSADKATALSLSSGFAVPIEAERVLKNAALACAIKYFEDDAKEGLVLLTGMLQKFSINTKARKSNTMLAGMRMLRTCVTQWISSPSGELGMRPVNGDWGRALGFVYAPRFNFNAL